MHIWIERKELLAWTQIEQLLRLKEEKQTRKKKKKPQSDSVRLQSDRASPNTTQLLTNRRYQDQQSKLL